MDEFVLIPFSYRCWDLACGILTFQLLLQVLENLSASRCGLFVPMTKVRGQPQASCAQPG